MKTPGICHECGVKLRGHCTLCQRCYGGDRNLDSDVEHFQRANGPRLSADQRAAPTFTAEQLGAARDDE